MSSASRKCLLLESRNVWQMYSSLDFRITALEIQKPGKNVESGNFCDPQSRIWYLQSTRCNPDSKTIYLNLSSKALTPLSSTRLLSVNQADINRSNTTVQIQPLAQHSPQTRIHVRLSVRSAQVVEAVAKVTLVS